MAATIGAVGDVVEAVCGARKQEPIPLEATGYDEEEEEDVELPPVVYRSD